jgi:hypothetical protein
MVSLKPINRFENKKLQVECKKAQPKEVMLPVQLSKSRAAAARNLYGLGPEQLLGPLIS